MATVYIGGASIDERGKASGGQAGNQTGRELRKQAYYDHHSHLSIIAYEIHICQVFFYFL